MATAIKRDVGLDVGTAAIFVSYSTLVLAIGIWGYAILPAKCTKDEVRNSMRTVIVSGAVMMTAFLAFGLCAVTCRQKVAGKKKGTYVVTSHTTPWWLLVFVLIMSAVSLGSIKTAQNAMKDNPKVCQGSGYDTWNKAANLIMVIQIVVMGVVLIMLGYRVWKKGKEQRRKKQEQIDKMMKDIDVLSEED